MNKLTWDELYIQYYNDCVINKEIVSHTFIDWLKICYPCNQFSSKDSEEKRENVRNYKFNPLDLDIV